MNINEYINSIIGLGGMSKEEYHYITNIIKEKAPCNVLVFSLGRDSKLWNHVNEGGRTLFLEDNEDWINKTVTPDIDYLKVNYTVPRIEWRERISNKDESLLVDLPDDVMCEKWDVIIVDGPLGGYDGTPQGNGPGRAQSIFTSYHLANNDTDVIVHDCDRIIENQGSSILFGTGLINLLGTLKHYRRSE